MENLDEIMKEIRDNKYDNELAELYTRDLLDREKEYD